MANIATNYRGNKYVASNVVELVKATYDFSLDTGAVASYNIMVPKHDLVCYRATFKVKTAVTTSASGTLSAGVTGSVAALVAATAAGSLTANAVVAGVSALGAGGVRLVADVAVLFDIATGALTAGKVDLDMLVARF